MTAFPRRQRGATLLVALIMLVILMLFAVSSMNTANTNLKVVGNMQAKNEALTASQVAIETVLSTPTFISSPTNAVAAPCGAANTMCFDSNMQVTTSPSSALYTTTLSPQPTCVTVKAIKNSELNLSNTEDLSCAAGQQQQFGVSGSVSGDSLCSNSVWEISAQTTGPSSGATATTVQGVGVRISSDDAGSSC